MSAKVWAAHLDGDALTGLIDGLWPETVKCGVVESSTEARLADAGQRLSWAEWSRGYVFGPSVEVRWEGGGSAFDVIMTCADERPATADFAPVLVLDEASVTPQIEWYFLWGENDVAIRGRLNYAGALRGKGRAKVGVVRYVDHVGRLVFHRYFDMRRELTDADEAAN